MEVELSNRSNNALKRKFRDRFRSGEFNFNPGRKKIFNGILFACSADWADLIGADVWKTRHTVIHQLELGKDATRKLDALLELLKGRVETSGDNKIDHNQVVNSIIDYAIAKIDDPEFRHRIMEFLLGNADDPDQLLLLEIPNPLYDLLKRDKAKGSPERVLSDLLNDKIGSIEDAKLKRMSKPAKPGMLASESKFLAVKVKPDIKTKLSDNLRPFAPSIVYVIEALSDANAAEIP